MAAMSQSQAKWGTPIRGVNQARVGLTRLHGPGEAERLEVDIERAPGDVAAASLATRSDRGEMEQRSLDLHGRRARKAMVERARTDMGLLRGPATPPRDIVTARDRR